MKITKTQFSQWKLNVPLGEDELCRHYDQNICRNVYVFEYHFR
jgi:hypothetical protein